MSGVRVGSRLAQLYALEQKVKLEIQAELARERVASPSRPPEAIAARAEVDVSANEAMAAIGASTAVVRAWAVAVGLVEAGRRGMLPRWVIDEYVDAHREGSS